MNPKTEKREPPGSRLRRDKRGLIASGEFATGFIAAGIIGIIGVLVIQLVFASVAPTMLNQTQSFENTGNLSDPDNNTAAGRDLSAGNRALVAVFDTLLIVSYVLVPLAIIFLVLGLALFVMKD